MVTEPPPDFAALMTRYEEAVALVRCAVFAGSRLEVDADSQLKEAIQTTLRHGIAAVGAATKDIVSLFETVDHAASD